jgi:hypothetical protein
MRASILILTRKLKIKKKNYKDIYIYIYIYIPKKLFHQSFGVEKNLSLCSNLGQQSSSMNILCVTQYFFSVTSL